MFGGLGGSVASPHAHAQRLADRPFAFRYLGDHVARRSENGPLAAIEWLDNSGLFVSPVSLRHWNEVPRQMEVCARLTAEFREDVAAYVREHWVDDFMNDRDGAHAEVAVRALLASRKGAPPLVGVDVLVDDPDFAAGNVPDMVMMDFSFPGGRSRPPAEITERMRTPRGLVDKLTDALHDSFIDPNEKNLKERAAAEAHLDTAALLAAQDVEDKRVRAGRIGYVELVADVDWPVWRPVAKAEKLLVAVQELWPEGCKTYEELAKELKKRGLTTLSGKEFTKASVVKVLIASRLVLGSDPPWK